MTVLNVIKNRKSVRKYLDRPVPDSKLRSILEAARLAPSSSNSQPWHFIVVKNKDLIKKLVYAVPFGVTIINKFMEKAPVVVVGCVKPSPIQSITAIIGRYNHIIDISIAMEHMVLVAEELKLGTCWIGWFDEGKVKNLLEIPRGSKVVAMLTLGYPAPDGKHVSTRRSLKEIYSTDKY